jgi:CBS domain-containing protein
LKTVSTTDSLADAIKILRKAEILSLPIVNKDCLNFQDRNESIIAQEDYNEYVGVLDVLDVVTFLAFFQGRTPIEERLEEVLASDLLSLNRHLVEGDKMNGLVVVAPEQTLAHVLELEAFGVRRLFVRSPLEKKDDKTFTPLKLLTQSDVLHYLGTHNFPELEQIQEQSLGLQHLKDFCLEGYDEELCICAPDVITRNAIQALVRCKAEALAIVDPYTGKFISSLEAADIVRLEITTEILEKGIDELPIGHLNTLSYKETVGEAMTLLNGLRGHCHHVFVVDELHRPIMCLTAEKLLLKICNRTL